jgi:hypothetical protein
LLNRAKELAQAQLQDRTMLTFLANFALAYLAIAFVIYLLVLTQELQGKPFFRTQLNNRFLDPVIFALIWLPLLLLCPLAVLGAQDDDD